MNNPRLEGIIKRFSADKKVEGAFWEKYQTFANYLLLKEIYHLINEEYPYESELDLNLLENVNFGKNDAMAVDGCFFIHNKEILHLNMDDDELEPKLAKLKDGFLHIILIQTKSGSFDASDLSTLSTCLNGKFSGQSEWNKFVTFQQRCNQLISSNDRINLKFWCYYVAGKEIDKNINSISTFTVRENELKLSMKSYFWITRDNDVKIEYLDDIKILDIWKDQQENLGVVNKIVDLIEITRDIDLAKIGKILFGAISFGELMKIIYNKEKQKRNDLYGYNVRDEIEESKIKEAIINTIKNDGEKFILLNNGITIVVDHQEKRGDKAIKLENIRIINGCQTCNAILEMCKNDDTYNNFQVGIRIIETPKNEELLGDITYSSNNQNRVTKENLISIHPKMFKLEQEYINFDLINNSSYESCLFERREGQYKNSEKKFIDMLAQAKAFISLWGRLPHEAAMYRDEILDKYSVYRENDSLFIIRSLISGIMWHNIYRQIPPKYDNARYHIFTTILLVSFENTFGIKNILNNDWDQGILAECNIEFFQKMQIEIPSEINNVISAVLSCKDSKGDLIFPTSTKSGKVHYRKFYPSSALTFIYDKYKELKNATNK